MNERILIVEDQFIEANDLRIILEKSGYQVVGIARSVQKALELLSNVNPDLVLLDIYLTGKLTGIDLAKKLRDKNIAFVYLSANSNPDILSAAKATQPYGFLVKPFREKDVLVTIDVALYRHEHSLETLLAREKVLHDLLKNISSEAIDLNVKLLKIVNAIQPFITFDFLEFGFEPNGNGPRAINGYLRIGFDEYQKIGLSEMSVIAGLKANALEEICSGTASSERLSWYSENEFSKRIQADRLKKLFADTFQLRSGLNLAMADEGDQTFNITFYSRRPEAYNANDLALGERLQQSLFTVIKTAISEENLPDTSRNYKPRALLSPKSNQRIPEFEGIIGSSHKLLNVFDNVTQVAPLDVSVLLLGESGTGKEKIANCIHDLSPRKGKPLITVNCASLPPSLIESELFGHEKGAFTGAIEKRLGRFEQAEGGSIFLDEIGEMQIDLQVKLLRVLQEREIDRIGGMGPIKINVRIIAATNRNLEKEVAEGRFRLDLYYRLNVFPILIPALHERTEDIEALAHYIAIRFCKKINKKFNGISAQMLTRLRAYNWPGNIRELENVIEQAIIINKGDSPLQLKQELNNSIPGNRNLTTKALEKPGIESLTDVRKLQDETERTYLLSVLEKAKGRIRGEHGAAKMLDINPTTLEARIAKLGIKRRTY